MELEVRVVGGIKSCFASLPLSLIYILQSGARKGVLPPLLALELRSLPGDAHWNVAWSGSASRSPAIEVSHQLAECISLPDRTVVQIKVVSNLPKASVVSIEPCSEDDWEIIELNSDLAEDTILKQVGIVHEGMKFPLWLHGHMVVKFIVLSTSPKQTVVQLVPGTEVIVAPKLHRKAIDTYQDCAEISSKGQLQTRALLRVQADLKREAHKVDFIGVELGVVLTTAVFMHSETATSLSFSNLQLVHILPKSHQDETQNTDPPRHTIVRLLLSDSAARGHVLIPYTLCLFLRARVHSWVYVKKIDRILRKDVSTFTLSPCQFKLYGNSRASDDSGSLKNLKNKDSPPKFDSILGADVPDWSLHDKFLSSLHSVSSKDGDEEAASKSNTRQKQYLIHAWVTGQLKAIALHAGEVDVGSVVLVNKTLLHFEVINTKKGNATHKAPIDICFLLSAKFEESSVAGLHFGFVLSFKTEQTSSSDHKDFDLKLGKLELEEPISLISDLDNRSNRNYSSTISSLNWLEVPSLNAINRLTILLSPSSGKLLSTHQLPLPGHVLVYGPPGCGKTSLTMAVAKYFEEHEEILAHIVFISCSKLSLEKSQTIRQSLTTYLLEALAHSPSLLIFDDLDHIVSSSSELEGSQPSNSVLQLVGFLTDVMDEYGEKRQNVCGLGPIAFMASVRSLGNLPQSLTSSGRFDFHIQLSSLGATERSAILKHEIEKRSIECAADILSDVASKCDGYDAYDLEILVDRAVHASIGRYLSSHDLVKDNRRHNLTRDEFSQAMQDFTPVAMRGVTKQASQGGLSGWGDVGGLVDIRNTIQEMIEMPSRFPSIFAQAPLRLRSNVLLYGPPGCGKTHIVGAAAAACALRFISVKGPELLNKYIGASEQAVRDLFSKAAAAAPCLLFFDEFDSIAPKRGHDNTGVTDRVVNQFLTELDGVEALTGVFVFAATSRPDLLDAALLRPGRLDRLLFCDFPSWHDRLDILKVLSRKLPLACDVNLETIASMTEGFSGADLQALLSDSELASVHELLENTDSSKSEKVPAIGDVLLRSVALKARPSVSESEKQRLYAIYNQFLDSKKSLNAQSRDAKGKRATLA